MRIKKQVSIGVVVLAAGVAALAVSIALLAHPRPGEGLYKSPAELFLLRLSRFADYWDTPVFPSVTYREMTEKSTILKSFDLAFLSPAGFSLAQEQEYTTIRGELVSLNFFAALGARPSIGRVCAEDDDGSRLVILSDSLHRRLGGGSEVLGRQLRLSFQEMLAQAERAEYTVIGVMPEGFVSPRRQPVDLWVCHSFPISAAPGQMSFYALGEVVGRSTLDRGLVAEQINAAYNSTMLRGQAATELAVIPLSAMKKDSEKTLLLLAGFLNVLSALTFLNYVRAEAVASGRRREEFAVRAALGGSSRALYGLLLKEQLLKMAVAGLAGTLVASGLLRYLRSSWPQLFIWSKLSLAGYGIAAAVLLSVALLTTIVVQIRARQRQVLTRSLSTVAGNPSYRFLPWGETVGVCLLVIVGMLMLFVAMQLLEHRNSIIETDYGFRLDDLVFFELAKTDPRFSPEVLYREVPRAAKELGAGEAAVMAVRPLPDAGVMRRLVTEEYHPEIQFDANGRPTNTHRQSVVAFDMSPEALSALQIPIQGNLPSRGESGYVLTIPAVAKLFPVTHLALGKEVTIREVHVRTGKETVRGTFRVWGIAPEAKLHGPEYERKDFVMQVGPLSPNLRKFTLLMSGAAGMTSRIARGLEQRLPVSVVKVSHGQELRRSFAEGAERLAIGVWIIAIVTLLVFVLGIYSAITNILQTMRRGDAVRMALGAESRQVVFDRVKLGVLWLSSSGILAGGILWAASHFLGRHYQEGVDLMSWPTAGYAFLVIAFVMAVTFARPLRGLLKISPADLLRE